MIKLFFAFLFTAASAGLFASDAPVHISSGNKWFIVDKSKTKSPALSVTLREINGEILVQEKIKKTTKYNLKFIPDGEYIIQVEDDQKLTTQKISISNGAILSKNASTIYKPYFIEKKDHLDMNLMTQGMPAEITIRNDAGEIISQEKITNEVSVTRRFNTKKLSKEPYYVTVELGGQTFISEFNK